MRFLYREDGLDKTLIKKGDHMLLTIPGVYENGVVKLSEKPEGIDFSKVLVTLLPQADTEETWESMKLSRQAFEEWDNDVDAVYDTL